MTFANEGAWDRAGRMLAGIALVSAGWGLASGMVGLALMIGGGAALVTGISGWCPAYTAFGFSTGNAPAGHCPHCDAGHRA